MLLTSATRMAITEHSHSENVKNIYAAIEAWHVLEYKISPPGTRQALQKPEPGKRTVAHLTLCEVKASGNATLDSFQPAFTAQTLWPMVSEISSTV